MVGQSQGWRFDPRPLPVDFGVTRPGSVPRLEPGQTGSGLLPGRAPRPSRVLFFEDSTLTISGLFFSRHRYTWRRATTGSRLSSCYCSTALMCTPRTRGKTPSSCQSHYQLLPQAHSSKISRRRRWQRCGIFCPEATLRALPCSLIDAGCGCSSRKIIQKK